MFNLAALGAGLGQFAQDYRQQQAQQERNLMLAMQLAHYKQELDKDRRDAESASLMFSPLPGGGFGSGGPQMSPIQTPPQLSGAPSALTGPMPQQRPSSFGAAGEYGVGQDTGYPFPTQGVRPGFPRMAGAENVPTGGPGFPGQGGPTQSDLLRTPAHEPSAAIPPASGGQSPAARGFPTTTTLGQAAGVARGLVGGMGGAAPASDAGMPKPPEPPPSAPQIAQWLYQQNPQADPRSVRQAAIAQAAQLQQEYRARQQDYELRLKQYEMGPRHQQERREKIEDAAAIAQIPSREGPKLIRGPSGQMREWQPGTPMPDGGVGWTIAGTGDPETRAHKEVTLENGVTVTGVPGKKDSWTTLTGEQLTPEMHKMLSEGRIQKFGSAASQVDPQTVKATAAAIASYKMAPITSWGMNRPFGQQVMAEVQRLNPDYDQAKYDQKKRALIAFTSGRQGDSVRSFSVSIDHLATMLDAATALENGDVQLLNRATQWVKQNLGYEGPVDFNFVKNVVGGEISKAIIGGVGGVTDREEMRNSFDRANSPEQLTGVINYAKRLMAGQLQGYRRQSESGGFPLRDFDAALSPRAKQELLGLDAGAAQTQPAQQGAAPQQSQAAPARMPLPAGLSGYADGEGFKKDGKIWVKQGNELVEVPGGVQTR